MPADVGCPYPGFDKTGTFYEQRPAPRVRPEAEEFAGRNKGSIDLFNASKHSHVIAPPKSPRCPSGAARQNYEQSRNGNVGSLIGGKGQPPPVAPQPVARVTGVGGDIAENHKGKNMNNLFSSYGQGRPSPRPNPRVKQEAEVAASLDKGSRMDSLLHSPNNLPETPRNAPRVKKEAENNSVLGKGASMSKIMGRYGETPRSTRPVPRVTKYSQDNAELGKGKAMEATLYSYGSQAPSQPAPKVKDGQEMANLDRGGRMSRMIHEANRIPCAPKPAMRASSSAGRSNIKKNRGTISDIFAENSKWQIVPRPGVRN